MVGKRTRAQWALRLRTSCTPFHTHPVLCGNLVGTVGVWVKELHVSKYACARGWNNHQRTGWWGGKRRQLASHQRRETSEKCGNCIESEHYYKCGKCVRSSNSRINEWRGKGGRINYPRRIGRHGKLWRLQWRRNACALPSGAPYPKATTTRVM